MKKLTLNQHFQTKVDRLRKPIVDAHYIGEDINMFSNKPIVAVIGTRKPSPYGKSLTTSIVTELARAGVVIISGLALGTDVLAHQATLAAGGTTIAVIPSGLDKPYPATNTPVAKKILSSGGSIISEYPDGYTPHRYDFLHRNRIVAALADAVLIPEAASRSGSLNTARQAREMGMPVYVLPGNVTSPMSSGTNKLLVDGSARAVTSAADILTHLGIDTNNKQLSLDISGDTEQETRILKAIAEGTSDLDNLQIKSALDTVELQTTLTMLEISGKIQQDSLGNWHL